jgi:hypothetical protein
MIDHRLVTERMQNWIDQWSMLSDPRVIFLNCYLLMTRNMLAAIEAGEFHDPNWVRPLLNRFAEYYFEALQAYEEHQSTTPKVWLRAHDAARVAKVSVLQHLMLGINAHINYDLVLTLVEMLQNEWVVLTKNLRKNRYLDHCHVNAVIARTIDNVQDDVVEVLAPELDFVDKFLGPVDEWLASQLITRWREEVWQHAVRLLESSDPQEQLEIHQKIENITLERANLILLKERPTSISSLF